MTAARAWKWYVYQFFRSGECMYVGKGSGGRLGVQRRRFKNFTGIATCYFLHEMDALAHEKKLILELAPPLNKLLRPKMAEPWKQTLLPNSHKDFSAWFDALGSRQMSLRVLLAKGEHQLSKFGLNFRELVTRLEPSCEGYGIRN